MEITKTPPKDYIASLPEERRVIIQKLDDIITKLLSEKSEKVMWEGIFWGGSEQKIIGYGIRTYKSPSSKKEVTWFLVGLTSQKNYITVFVNVVDGKEYVAEKYRSTLGKAKIGKSSISFTKLEDINLDVLENLLKRAFEIGPIFGPQ